MIAVTEFAVVSIAVASIALVSSTIAAWFAYKGTVQGRTSNGRTMGEVVEDIADRVARMEMWWHEHQRDHMTEGRRAEKRR